MSAGRKDALSFPTGEAAPKKNIPAKGSTHKLHIKAEYRMYTSFFITLIPFLLLPLFLIPFLFLRYSFSGGRHFQTLTCCFKNGNK